MTKEEKLKEYKKLWYAKNKEKCVLRSKEHYEKHKEEKKEYQRKWREENRETHRAYSRQWNKENPEKARERLTKWYEANPGMRAVYGAQRKKHIALATPDWLSDHDILRIKGTYQVCAMRRNESDIDWHVDHVVPLRGKTVCGLHVPWNLKIIPAKENMSKGNKFNG